MTIVATTTLLAIDIGNTQTVLGVYAGDKLKGQWRLASISERTADELEVLIRGLFGARELDIKAVDGVAISSVVPALTPVYSAVANSLFDLDPLVVGPGIRTGMAVRYDDPREMGADRIVNAVAAFACYQKAVIVVDFGTATTFDCVSEDGAYLGGAIAPGMAVSMEALFSRASKLPKVALERPPRAIGRNTVHSMQSGVYYGYAAMVDGLIQRLTEEMKVVPTVVATGGAAASIASEAKSIEHVDEMLTLEGLRLLFELNSK
jgi:type III pantothenate kinase